MFYGMYILVQEEFNSKVIDIGSRFIMELDQASRMPVCENTMINNSYIPVSLTDNQILPKIIFPMASDPYHRGLYSTYSFKERFNIITNNIFENFDYNNILICGSIVQFCAFRNPLEQTWGINLDVDEDVIFDIIGDINIKKDKISKYWKKNKQKLIDQFNDYYDDSDIDIIIKSNDDNDYIKKVHEIYEHVSKIFPEAKLMKIPTKKKFKYKIINIPIILELFRVYIKNPEQRITGFHLSIVRNWYDGYKVYLTASSICTAFSGVFYEYKWIGNTHNPEEIIQKYYRRGFYPILNDNEVKDIVREYPEIVNNKTISMSNPILRTSSKNIVYIPDFYQEEKGIPIRNINGHIIPVKHWIYMRYIDE